MPRFVYKAKAGPGEIKEGLIQADTERAAVYKLSRMGLYPINIEEELSAKGLKNSSFFTGKRGFHGGCSRNLCARCQIYWYQA